MSNRPLAALLLLSFVWTLGGAGELFAAGLDVSPSKDLSDIPSTGEVVVMGVVAATVVVIIVLLIVNSGDDEEDRETEEVSVSEIEEPAPPVRIDPVLTLGRDTLGAGLAISF